MSSSHEQRNKYELIRILAMIALHVRADHVALGYLKQLATSLNDMFDATNVAPEIEGLSFSALIGIENLRTSTLEQDGIIDIENVIKMAKEGYQV